MSFASDMKKWAEKTKMKEDEAIRSATVSISEGIIYLTPEDTGRLRGNWIPSINAPKIAQTDNTTPLMEEVQSTAAQATGKVFYLVNSLPYARVAEYGEWSQPGTSKTVGGFSIKAPQGMVRISVQNFKEALKKAVK